MSIAPNATEERPQALGRVFRHEFARALAYLRLGAIPAYIVAYFGIRRVFRVTDGRPVFESDHESDSFENLNRNGRQVIAPLVLRVSAAPLNRRSRMEGELPSSPPR